MTVHDLLQLRRHRGGGAQVQAASSCLPDFINHPFNYFRRVPEALNTMKKPAKQGFGIVKPFLPICTAIKPHGIESQ